MKRAEQIVAPCQTETVRVFGVVYTHVRCRNQDDLYLTEFGLPFLQHLLPENWFLEPSWFRQNAVRLTGSSSIFRVRTKPVLNRQIDVVLKWNRMGQEVPGGEDRDDFLNWRFNSPFEEVDLALYLRSRGVPTLNPLAVYMAGHRRELAPYLFHESRHIRHRHLLNPDGTPLLRADRSYITIWGSWNQVEAETDGEEEDFYERMSALRAYQKRVIPKSDYVELMRIIRERLRKVDVEDLTLRGTHILVSLNNRGRLIRDAHGVPKAKLCSFELLRRL